MKPGFMSKQYIVKPIRGVLFKKMSPTRPENQKECGGRTEECVLRYSSVEVTT